MMNMDGEEFDDGIYGFLIPSDSFMIFDTETFNITLMVKLFENMESFILFRTRYLDYCDSLGLNEAFVSNMISSLNILNQRSKLISIKMRKFVFIKPSSSIIQTIESIENNQEKFNKIRWYLSI